MHLHVHADVVRQSAHEEFRLLAGGDFPGVSQDRLKTACELLHRGVEGQPAQLYQASAANGWSEAKATQVLEPIPWRLALVLLEGIVPRLGIAREVIGRHPGSL